MSETTLVEQEAATLSEREVVVLQTLEQSAAERARAEAETQSTYLNRRDAEAKSFREALEKLTTASKAEIASIQARYQSVKKEINKKYETDRQATEFEYDEARKKIATRYKSGRNAAKKELDESRWQILALFEGAKDGMLKEHKANEAEIAAADESFHLVHDDSEVALSACRRFAGAVPSTPAPSPEIPAPPAPETPAPPPPEPGAEAAEAVTAAPAESPLARYNEVLKTADDQLTALVAFKLPRFLKLQNFVWPFILIALGAAYPLVLALGMVTGAIVDVVAAIVLGVAVWFWLASLARKRVGPLYLQFRQSLDEAERLSEQSWAWETARFERRKVEIEQRRESETKQAEKKNVTAMSAADLLREKDTNLVEAKYPALLEELLKKRDLALNEADDKYPKRLAEAKQRFETESRQLHENYKAQKEATEKRRDDSWNALATNWRNGLARASDEVAQIDEVCRQAFLDWDHADLAQWRPPTAVPSDLRFGEFTIDLNEVAEGVSEDERLRAMGPSSFTMPALLDFPEIGSLLIKTTESGRSAASELLQAAMIRVLTSIPPGKVRFTIIDPVGLGENFAGFMHLADYHELLVTSRIWTEAGHIEQRLADLSEHMENVIQKYLRNEFQSIEEYNVHAGEVAEPFRILVVANFPANFSEQAARRLVSIVSSGPRCGVFTLMSVDMKQPMPSGMQVKELEPHCVNLTWRDAKLRWRNESFGRFPLKLDAPPSQETVSRVMHIVGERARDANRVEVPFEFIAPKPENFWKSDSRKGIDVPLGRAGATKLQHLRLGKGTSQHVLIAGKTGSGKSTLLHALIVNAALRYSPDELELYLIDFKKGVEFKVYAAMQLPHARVIAVESEREFGVSVLQRLDLELKKRGDMFRDLGVQDLRGYRDLENGVPLPRILFLVDEFQEFFVEDDKIAQETSLLLDRLVRQGRAFGIHVHLGSQTLGGAYSLARSTLGQMAVRIALQCSEADAHMILSEDNSAARLLTRPGEAIYNDANGMVEGNNFFQVVWLSDERREEYLKDIQRMNKERNRPPASQIVFEGNLPADATKNHLLNSLLEAPGWPELPKADFAWLGDAIAIKDPTAAIFRPQSGSNLLIVGQFDEGALGIMTNALVSLAAQHDPTTPAANARFYLFDGSPADSSNYGRLAKVAEVVPHPLVNVTWRTLGATLKELTTEIERRQKDEAGESPVVYLFIFDLQRFRDLRKSDDDYGGFSRYGEDKPEPASRLFGTVLRDGPPLGIHTIIWCDSLNNLNRTFDRQGLKEFEIRVLFQMSANDSSSLIDSPAGSKLGENRGLYFSEEEGRLEKFRPYGIPTDEWLDTISRKFAGRPAPVASNGPPREEAAATMEEVSHPSEPS